jgi:hypothetical protein
VNLKSSRSTRQPPLHQHPHLLEPCFRGSMKSWADPAPQARQRAHINRLRLLVGALFVAILLHTSYVSSGISFSDYPPLSWFKCRHSSCESACSTKPFTWDSVSRYPSSYTFTATFLIGPRLSGLLTLIPQKMLYATHPSCLRVFIMFTDINALPYRYTIQSRSHENDGSTSELR